MTWNKYSGLPKPEPKKIQGYVGPMGSPKDRPGGRTRKRGHKG
jgi:hypothetical protein